MAAVSTPGLSLSYVNALAIGKRSRGAAIGLLFYDHITCLEQEIRLVWTKDKRRPGFYLYIFNRFFAFLYYVWDTIPMTPDGTNTSKNCAIFLMCDGIVTLIATLVVQIILQLRIFALYNSSRRILIFLLVFCTMEVTTMAILVAVTMAHLEHLPIASTNTGCAYEGILELSALFWLPGLVFEPVLFMLVANKAWDKTNRIPFVVNKALNKRIPLEVKMARESLIYFVAIFTELLLNTIIWARAPEYINIVNPWSAALPSLLGKSYTQVAADAFASPKLPNVV